MFYYHQENLDSHIDGIEKQIREIRFLQNTLIHLNATIGLDQYHQFHDCLYRLGLLEQCLIQLKRVLENHTEEVSSYYQQLAFDLDALNHQIDHLFV